MPVYIQEKIHPQAIIDALPRTERTGDAQTNLFADFNGLKAISRRRSTSTAKRTTVRSLGPTGSFWVIRCS